MKQNSSSRRVCEQAREVIAQALLFDISDERLSCVTITGCEVSFDRSVCNVYYSAPKDKYEDASVAFQRAKGRIRKIMSQNLSWRKTPELNFILDDTVDVAARIGQALSDEEARSSSAPCDMSNYKMQAVNGECDECSESGEYGEE